MTAYYNEFDPYAAQWLRNLIAAGHIAPGDVDERSIVDVRPDDLKSYAQCHFFSGIGGWSLAARLARWPDDRPLWTGSCPCQPFSVAGKGAGSGDVRHLWPVFFDLIRACQPDVVMGEQVAAAVGKNWLDGVHSDLEGIGYACGAAVVPACAVDAPHRRDRLWFVADSQRERRERRQGASDRHEPDGQDAGRVESDGRASSLREDDRRGRSDVVDTNDERREELRGAEPIRAEQPSTERAGGGAKPSRGSDVADAERIRREVAILDARSCDETSQQQQAGKPRVRSAWDGAGWITGADGKARRVEPGIRLLAHGVPARVGKLRAYGNAIVPQVAAEVIGAYLDAERVRLTGDVFA